MDLTEGKKQELLILFPEACTEDGKIDFARLRMALPENLERQRELRKSETKHDTAWHNYDEDIRELDRQKDALRDEISHRLDQHTENRNLFIIVKNNMILQFPKWIIHSIDNIYIRVIIHLQYTCQASTLIRQAQIWQVFI